MTKEFDSDERSTEAICQALFEEIAGAVEVLKGNPSPPEKKAAEEVLVQAYARAAEFLDQNGYRNIRSRMKDDIHDYYVDLSMKTSAGRLIDVMESQEEQTGKPSEYKGFVEDIARETTLNKPKVEPYLEQVSDPFHLLVGALFIVDVHVEKYKFAQVREAVSRLLGQKK